MAVLVFMVDDHTAHVNEVLIQRWHTGIENEGLVRKSVKESGLFSVVSETIPYCAISSHSTSTPVLQALAILMYVCALYWKGSGSDEGSSQSTPLLPCPLTQSQ